MLYKMVIVFALTIFSCVGFAQEDTSTETEEPEWQVKPTRSAVYDIGGFSLYLECYENDNPLLIIEQDYGGAGSKSGWQQNIQALQQEFSVCLYDRSSLGKSKKGPEPATVFEIAARLKMLLNKAKLKGPYYFAGNAYAAYILRAYHHLYPTDVAGTALFAPTPFGYFHLMATRWPDNFKTDNKDLQNYYLFEQTILKPMQGHSYERIDHMRSYQQLKEARDYGDKPLMVVFPKPTGTALDPAYVPEDVAKKMSDLYQGLENQYRQLSTQSKVLYSQSQKFKLHEADQKLVVSVIKSLKQNKG